MRPASQRAPDPGLKYSTPPDRAAGSGFPFGTDAPVPYNGYAYSWKASDPVRAGRQSPASFPDISGKVSAAVPPRRNFSPPVPGTMYLHTETELARRLPSAETGASVHTCGGSSPPLLSGPPGSSPTHPAADKKPTPRPRCADGPPVPGVFSPILSECMRRAVPFPAPVQSQKGPPPAFAFLSTRRFFLCPSGREFPRAPSPEETAKESLLFPALPPGCGSGSAPGSHILRRWSETGACPSSVLPAGSTAAYS